MIRLQNIRNEFRDDFSKIIQRTMPILKIKIDYKYTRIIRLKANFHSKIKAYFLGGSTTWVALNVLGISGRIV